MNDSRPSPPTLDRPAKVYLWLTSIFVTSLLMANILGVKLFVFDLDALGLTDLQLKHTVGMLPFPITFLLTDLLNEYYGKAAARRTTYIAFAMGGLGFLLISLARQMPTLEGIPGTASHDAFENVFGSAAWMYLSSLAAFLIGSMLDIFLFGVFKRLTGGRYVWLRATGSTVVSQLFDSFLITIFYFKIAQTLIGNNPASWEEVLEIALTGYILKFIIAVLLTPFIYLGRWAMHNLLGLTPLPASAVA